MSLFMTFRIAFKALGRNKLRTVLTLRLKKLIPHDAAVFYVVRENRTNTSLQALNLMNDTTFLEAARVLAQRALAEGGAAPSERIGYAFRLATARRPRPSETDLLLTSLRRYQDRYGSDRAAALQ